MNKIVEREKLGLKVELAEPTQKQLEIYEETLMALAENSKSSAKFNSSVVRGALSARIILSGLMEADVDGMKPAAVKWLSAEILSFVNGVKTIPLA